MNIIFDLDGTLWDASNEIQIAWNNILKKYSNLNQFDQLFFKKIMGLSNKSIESILQQYYNIYDETFLEKCHNEELRILKQNGAQLYSNVKKTIEHLSLNNKLYIVSNCQNEYIECFLNYYKMQKYFTDYICTDNYFENKTESLAYLLNRNSIKNFFYIGDTEGDFVACSNLGGSFIFANYGFGYVECETKINNFIELLDLFD